MAGRIFLIHWNGPEAEDRAGMLAADGWDVEIESADGGRAGARVKDGQPDVVVIYLDRLPSHGRETAAYLRSGRGTRHIPIVFVGGHGEPLEKTRVRMPDATFPTSQGLLETLRANVPGARPAQSAAR